MKRSHLPRLPIKRETIREIEVIETIDLGRVVGGYSSDAICPAVPPAPAKQP